MAGILRLHVAQKLCISSRRSQIMTSLRGVDLSIRDIQRRQREQTRAVTSISYVKS